MKKNPLVSLVIPSYNGKDLSVKLLDSLKNLEYNNFEIILVDNGSSDGTYEYVKKRYPYVKSMKIRENKGFTGGINTGIKQAKGKYIVVMNNDMVVLPDWLSELVKVAESDKNIGIVGSTFTAEDIDFVRLGYIESNKIFLNFKPLDIPKNRIEEIPEVVNVDNTFGLTRREVFEKIGLFDEKYFIYWEEIDLCYRAKKIGYKIVTARKAELWHNSGSTMKKFSYLKTFHYHKNKIRFILKNFSFFRKIINVPLTLTIFFGEIVLNSLKRDFRKSLAIINAIIWNILNFRDYL